jgi:hypothetical protein
MILRIPFLSPTNTGSPDYTIAGQASSLVDWTNLNTVIKVGGTDIINEADLSAFAGFGIGVDIACGGGVVVNDIINESLGGGSVLKIKITMPATSPLNIATYTDVQIIAQKTNYISYDNTYRIHDYDLGNNADSGVTNNLNFGIYLISTVDNVVSGQQTKPFSKMNYIPEPFTHNVRVYNAVSNGGGWGGSLEYRDINDDVVLTADGVINLVNFPNGIKLRNILPNDEYDETPTQSNVDYSFRNKPTLSHNGIEPVSTNETIEAYTDLQYINLDSTLFRNDALLGSAYKKGRLRYDLVDMNENVVASYETTFTASGSPSLFNYDKYGGSSLFSFAVTSTGAFTIRVTYTALAESTDVELYSLVDTYVIAGTFWLELQKIECNVFNVKNSFYDGFIVTVSILNDNKVWETVTTVTLDSGENQDVTLAEDGVYKFTTEVDDVEYSYIVPSFCDIETCIRGFVNDILVQNTKSGCCDKCADKANAKNIFNFNAILLSMDIYVQLVSEYGLSYIFENDENIVLEDLWNIRQIGKRLTEYCKDCDCGCS